MKSFNLVVFGLLALLVFYAIRQELRVIRTVEPAAPAIGDPSAPPVPLRVLARHGYFSPEVTAAAEAALNVRFEATFYFNDAQCRALLDSGASWDLLLVPDHLALRLDRLNRSIDIDYEKIPNHRNLVLGLPMPQQMGALVRCSVPFFFTTVGIGYDSNLVGSIPLSWQTLFAPEAPALVRGHLGLLNESRRTLGIALLALGKSPNSRDPADIRQAADLVRQCMALIAVMDPSPDATQGGAAYIADQLDHRRVFLGMVTSAAISRAMETNPALRFSSPNEGALVCIDAFAIPRDTKDRATAEAAINFFLRPRISAQLTNESGYATTNEASTAYYAPHLYHGPAFASPTGRQFSYLQDVGDAEALYAEAWRDLTAWYQAHVAPVLNREVGFDRTFIEGNDNVP